MNCLKPDCQAPLSEGARFCNHCGTPVSSMVKCRQCGTENKPSARFCTGCGASTAGATTVAGAPVSTATEAAYAATGGEFLYELTEEEFARRTAGKKMEPPPVGCVAINIADGRLQWVTSQKAIGAAKAKREPGSSEDEGSFLGRVLRKVVAWVSGSGEDGRPARNGEAPSIKPQPKSRTFIMMNVQDLPLLNFELPTPMPGLLDSRLKFSFWVRTPLEYERKKSEAGDGKKKEGADDPAEAEFVRHLELFFGRVVGNRTRLSVSEMLTVASSEATRFVQADGQLLASLQAAQEKEALKGVVDTLRNSLGIDAQCAFVRGKNGVRHHIDVSKTPLRCRCGNTSAKPVNNCRMCGQPMPQESTFLQLANREQVTLRISMLADDSQPGLSASVDRDKLAFEIVTYLMPVLRGLDPQALADEATRERLTEQLNDQLYKDWRGYISDFRVEGMWTAREDWMFQKDAQVAEAEREIEHLRRWWGASGVEAQKLDLQELEFALTMRETRQFYREQADSLAAELEQDRRLQSIQGDHELAVRRDELERSRQGEDLRVDEASLENRTDLRLQTLNVETRRQSAALEVDEHGIEADADLKKEGINADADRVRFAREQERLLREREGARTLDRGDREYERERGRDERQDDVEQLGHEMRLQKDTLKHDLELSDLTLEAERRKRSADREDHAVDREQELRLRTAESEQELRLRAAEREKLGHIDEDLKDREARRRMEEERQELEHSRWVIEQQAQAELAKRNAMQGLDAAQMLAMQAAELAKSGAAADIFKSVFQSQAEASVANQKEELYKQMLAMQREANQATVEAHREAARIAQSTGERAMDSMARVSSGASAQANEGYREAARIAQSTNEKSMDSMARVASNSAQGSAAGFQEGVNSSRAVTERAMQSVAEVASAGKSRMLACRKCGFQTDQPGKFCDQCGAPQEA